MTVGFLTTEFPGLTPTGGIGTSIRNLGHALTDMGVRVTVYVIADCEAGRTELDGLAVCTIRFSKGVPLSGLRTRLRTAAIINRDFILGRLDVLEAPDWGGISALIPLLCPVVVRCNGSETYFADLDHRPVRPRTHVFETASLRAARSVVSVSAFTARRTKELFNLVDQDIEIVQNCVPREFLEGTSEGDDRRRQPLIAYIGTLVRKKGVFELPGIFNRVHEARPDIRLVLAGRDNPDGRSGSTWRSMQTMFTPSAGANVDFLGSIPYDKVRSLLHTASVCVFPSYAEAFPLSWLEAMASRCPVVASNIGWAGEMIDDGITGYLVPPDDHATFAARILQVLADPTGAFHMGQLAREQVLRCFSGKVIARRSLAIYHAAM